MRVTLIAGNWKMHKTHLEAMRLVQEIGHELADVNPQKVEVAVCPPFTSLRTIQTLIDADRYDLVLGAQNMYFADEGAYTGEISAGMLKALNVTYVILGHSERREILGETDEEVNAKVKMGFDAGLTPIICCGETESEHAAQETHAKVERQIQAALAGVSPDRARAAVIAYEPIWAIGTGQTATPADAQATIGYVRSVLADMMGPDAAGAMRLLYGGSVKAGNAKALLSQPDIDGALVGGASIAAPEFSAIVKAVT
ncbi:MAG: triose-phosphate isomerase [Actinomycetota bacterium]|nr:triose-phosphate isomerase [Actinomycetota bacterium]